MSSKDKLYALSDCMEDDLTSVQLMKEGKWVACTSSEGVIMLFKWDWFGDFKDRIIGHPCCIDAMVGDFLMSNLQIKINENTLITGCDDGFLRGVGLFPNGIVKVLGQHEEDEQLPITGLSMAHCQRIVASISHDNSIKFYDVSKFVSDR